MPIESGIIDAFHLAAGGGRRAGAPLDAAAVDAWTPESGPIWLHLDRTEPAVQAWLRDSSGIDEIAVEDLLAEGTAPRFETLAGGHLVNLRGVNLNPGAEIDDMLAVRIWLEPDRIVTLRRDPIQAIREARDSVRGGGGPETPAGVAVAIAAGLVMRLSNAVTGLDEAIDELEERIVEPGENPERMELARLRRRIVKIRRFVAPDREALSRMTAAAASRAELEPHAALLHELETDLTRLVETLDALRDRAILVQDELLNLQNDLMNRRMYAITIIAAIFLPLGFLTGLLGINVGGMPGVESGRAFWIATGLMLGVGVLLAWMLRRLRWI